MISTNFSIIGTSYYISTYRIRFTEIVSDDCKHGMLEEMIL